MCCVTHEIDSHIQRAGKGKYGNIIIHDGAWIGIKSVVLPNVVIGSGPIVAAGAVVTNDVPSNVLVAGVPAKVVKKLDD